VQGRAQRLLGPWLVWSAVYAAFKLLEVTVTGVPLGHEFTASMILTGPALHLWFLPFAFVVCVLAYPLARISARVPAPGQGTAIAALAGLTLASLLLQQGAVLATPVAQWVYALPSVCLGLAMALIQTRETSAYVQQAALMVLGISVCALMVHSEAFAGLLQLMLAAMVYLTCISLPRAGTRFSDAAGDIALTVFLAHPLILAVLTRTTEIAKNSLTLAVLACGIAVVLSFAIKLLPAFVRVEPVRARRSGSGEITMT